MQYHPQLKNGTIAIPVLYSLSFTRSKNTASAAAITAVTKASRIISHPKNPPQATISFISPPPKTPGRISVAVSIRLPIAAALKIRSRGVTPGMKNTAATAIPKINPQSRSEIFRHFRSLTEAAVTRQKNTNTSSVPAVVPLQIFR